jgi:hypothetical protein
MFAERANAANNLTKESAERCIFQTPICPKQVSIAVHAVETYLISDTKKLT